MTDFPTTLCAPPGPVISTTVSGGTLIDLLPTTNAVAAWPAANRALYIPFPVERTVTAYQIGWINGTTVSNTAGDMDVGIYNEKGDRLVSQGGTIVQTPISAIQLSDITNTTLAPGVYYLAICVSQTNSTFARRAPTALSVQVCGVQQQAVGAVTLPVAATFANPASAYIPAVFIAIQNATI